MSPAFSVRPAVWGDDESAIAQVRRTVFIEEQGVPAVLEWEARDAECRWFLARDAQGRPVGIARLTPEGTIGRMAVLAPWRRQGVGSALLAAALCAARTRGLSRITLSAQTHALGFYARHGFVAVGPEFPDAGIPHRAMTLEFLP